MLLGVGICLGACTDASTQTTSNAQNLAESKTQSEMLAESQELEESSLEFLEDRDLITVGEHYVAMVTAGGDVLTVYHPDWQNTYREVLETEWKDAVKMMKQSDYPVAISSAGKLLVPNGQTPEDLQEDLQKQIDNGERPNLMSSEYPGYAHTMVEWSNLRQVYRNYPSGAIGLCEDGSLMEIGLLGVGLTEENWTTIQSWNALKDLVVLYDGSEIAGLDEDGNVYGVGAELGDLDWENIVSIESGDRMLFGLTEEGKVIYTEFGFGKEYSTETMEDIVFISAGYSHTEEIDVVYGITCEGKVIDRFGNELPGFEDIVEIDVSPAGETIVVGLKSDGTVCVSENADVAIKEAVSTWNRNE